MAVCIYFSSLYYASSKLVGGGGGGGSTTSLYYIFAFKMTTMASPIFLHLKGLS